MPGNDMIIPKLIALKLYPRPKKLLRILLLISFRHL